jgi:ABC-type hemin transport system ATPase subunit
MTTPEISDDDVATLAELCKSPHGLSASVTPPDALSDGHIPATTTASAVAVSSITHVSDVNALAPNETLSFAGTGLTVIYGDNGAGKSGFTRILRRACRARGADDAILANALSDKPAGAPTARIEYSVSGATRSHLWKDGAVADPELSAVSVFDSASAQVYVEEKTEVRFRPFGLDVVDRAAATCLRVKKVLDGEVAVLQARVTRLPTLPSTTEAGRLLTALSALTSRREVDRLGALSDPEEKELESITDLFAAAKAEDPKKKAADLRVKAGRLRRLRLELRDLGEALAESRIRKLVALEAESGAAAEEARRFADALAKHLPLQGVGTPEWSALWSAAKAYSEMHAYPGHDFPHTSDGAACVLCQQMLSPSGRASMQKMGGFALGETREAARIARETADDARRAIVALQPGDRNKDGIADLEGIDALVAAKVSAFLTAAGSCCAEVAVGASSPNACNAPPPLTEIDDLVTDLESRAEGFARVADPAARAKQEVRLAELGARKTLRASLADVHGEIDRRARINAYNQCIKDTDTRGLTKLGGELTKKYVTDALTAAFDAELVKLGFTTLQLEIKPASAQRGQLFHRVQLKHATNAVLPKVVSEGESRCIALAAFMAELQGAGHDSTLVFDDPVSSLDHRWRSNVARRLVDAAAVRQVVVFTHELVFLAALLHEAERAEVQAETRTLTRDNEYAGHVSSGLPWHGVPTKKRIGLLRDRWTQADKVFRTSGPDGYDPLATSIYADLRRTWERAIEEVLLNQVVLRFRQGIETNRLKKIGDITPADLEAVENGMTKSSKWEGGHDQALAVNERLPSPAELKRDIDALESWVSGVVERRK